MRALFVRAPAACFIAALTVCLSSPALSNERGASLDAGDDPSSVLVVANASQPVSLRLAKLYMSTRSIPAENLVALDAPASEEIDRRSFDDKIRRPLEDHLWKERIVERIFYIVLMKGVPLKISGSDGPDGNRASVDNEIALLYKQIAGGGYPLNGHLPNPYFNADPSFTGLAHAGAPEEEGSAAKDSSPATTRRPWGLYFVTRLDGYTEADVEALIGRGSSALGSRGRFVFDLRTSGQGDDWMRRAASVLRARGADVLLEQSAAPVTGEENVLGYCSWGSNDPRYPGRGPRNGWALGSIAVGFISSDARTFHEPPSAWRPGAWRKPAAFFEGTPQSLLADLIREGITGGVGNAYEPYLDACPHPEILFPAYLAGYNLAESCYLALPYLSWQTVIIGDPLCRIVAR